MCPMAIVHVRPSSGSGGLHLLNEVVDGSRQVVGLGPQIARRRFENPRVVRLTQGKLAKLNFAAANLRVIRLEVSDASFGEGSERPSSATVRALGKLLPLAEEEASLLRIVYAAPDADRILVRRRLEGIETLIDRAWAAKPRSHPLSVETRIID